METNTFALALSELCRLRALRSDTAVLLLVERHGNSVTELAKMLGLEYTTVSMALYRLRRDNLVVLTQPAKDTRLCAAYLTTEGITRCNDLRNALAGLIA